MFNVIVKTVEETFLYWGNAKVFDIAPPKNAAVFGLAKSLIHTVALKTSLLAIGLLADKSFVHKKAVPELSDKRNFALVVLATGTTPLLVEIISIAGATYITNQLGYLLEPKNIAHLYVIQSLESLILYTSKRI